MCIIANKSLYVLALNKNINQDDDFLNDRSNVSNFAKWYGIIMSSKHYKMIDNDIS